MKKAKKPIWIVVLAICATVVIVGGVMIIRSMTASPAVKRDDVTSTEPVSSTELSGETKADETPKKTINSFGYELADPGDLNIDFKKLKSINTDIYAWLYVPNTKVDYAVVRGEADKDDYFYLNHNIYRQYQFSGSIYSELKNSPDLTDPVTVMYGHNMLDGSMFASLHKFEDADFFKKNTTFFVVTEDKILTYLIYSAYEGDDRHILNSYDFNDAESLKKYQDSTLSPRSYNYNVRENVELTEESRILTLSTCTGSSNTRYIVQGVLVDEQEK